MGVESQSLEEKVVLVLTGASLRNFTSGVLGAEEDVDDEQDCADGDGGIGDVEGGIVVGAQPDFEKIGDGSMENAIGDVASGAAEEEREASGGHRATAGAGYKKPG